MKVASQKRNEIPSKETIIQILFEVIDPDLGCSIVDIGLIYDVLIEEESIKVIYSLTSPFCPAGDQIHEDILSVLKASLDYKDITAELVWVPVWGPERMSEELRLSLGLPI